MQLELLGTSGCHLCDIAERMVRRIAPVLGFSLVYTDIASDDQLVEQYGMQIPVLKSRCGTVLGWPFNEDELTHWLKALNAKPAS